MLRREPEAMGGSVTGVDVSRETMADLQSFAALVEKWTPRINLIARGSVSAIWDRHICDSVQIAQFAPPDFQNWVDIGSGGGFPGIVMAILGKANHPHARFTMIESDQRKAAFLRTAARELHLNVNVLAVRIADAPPQRADVVSARALAALSSLIPLAQRHLKPEGLALFHKGRQSQAEVSQAQKEWSFALEDHVSLTDPAARILSIQRIIPLGT